MSSQQHLSADQEISVFTSPLTTPTRSSRSRRRHHRHGSSSSRLQSGSLSPTMLLSSSSSSSTSAASSSSPSASASMILPDFSNNLSLPSPKMNKKQQQPQFQQQQHQEISLHIDPSSGVTPTSSTLTQAFVADDYDEEEREEVGEVEDEEEEESCDDDDDQENAKSPHFLSYLRTSKKQEAVPSAMVKKVSTTTTTTTAATSAHFDEDDAVIKDPLCWCLNCSIRRVCQIPNVAPEQAKAMSKRCQDCGYREYHVRYQETQNGLFEYVEPSVCGRVGALRVPTLQMQLERVSVLLARCVDLSWWNRVKIVRRILYLILLELEKIHTSCSGEETNNNQQQAYFHLLPENVLYQPDGKIVLAHCLHPAQFIYVNRKVQFANKSKHHEIPETFILSRNNNKNESNNNNNNNNNNINNNSAEENNNNNTCYNIEQLRSEWKEAKLKAEKDWGYKADLLCLGVFIVQLLCAVPAASRRLPAAFFKYEADNVVSWLADERALRMDLAAVTEARRKNPEIDRQFGDLLLDDVVHFKPELISDKVTAASIKKKLEERFPAELQLLKEKLGEERRARGKEEKEQQRPLTLKEAQEGALEIFGFDREEEGEKLMKSDSCEVRFADFKRSMTNESSATSGSGSGSSGGINSVVSAAGSKASRATTAALTTFSLQTGAALTSARGFGALGFETMKNRNIQRYRLITLFPYIKYLEPRSLLGLVHGGTLVHDSSTHVARIACLSDAGERFIIIARLVISRDRDDQVNILTDRSTLEVREATTFLFPNGDKLKWGRRAYENLGEILRDLDDYIKLKSSSSNSSSCSSVVPTSFRSQWISRALALDKIPNRPDWQIYYQSTKIRSQEQEQQGDADELDEEEGEGELDEYEKKMRRKRRRRKLRKRKNKKNKNSKTRLLEGADFDKEGDDLVIAPLDGFGDSDDENDTSSDGDQDEGDDDDTLSDFSELSKPDDEMCIEFDHIDERTRQVCAALGTGHDCYSSSSSSSPPSPSPSPSPNQKEEDEKEKNYSALAASFSAFPKNNEQEQQQQQEEKEINSSCTPSVPSTSVASKITISDKKGYFFGAEELNISTEDISSVLMPRHSSQQQQQKKQHQHQQNENNQEEQEQEEENNDNNNSDQNENNNNKKNMNKKKNVGKNNNNNEKFPDYAAILGLVSCCSSFSTASPTSLEEIELVKHNIYKYFSNIETDPELSPFSKKRRNSVSYEGEGGDLEKEYQAVFSVEEDEQNDQAYSLVENAPNAVNFYDAIENELKKEQHEQEVQKNENFASSQYLSLSDAKINVSAAAAAAAATTTTTEQVEKVQEGNVKTTTTTKTSLEEHQSFLFGQNIPRSLQLSAQLAEGSSGVKVFLCLDLISHKLVALKRIVKRGGNNDVICEIDESTLRKLKKEAAIMEILTAPESTSAQQQSQEKEQQQEEDPRNHIVRYDGVFFNTFRSEVLVFMEFLSGCHLAHLRMHFKPTELQVKSLTEQMLLALAHAHSRRIVHNDFKSNNVLLLVSGVVKVIDWTESRQLVWKNMKSQRRKKEAQHEDHVNVNKARKEFEKRLEAARNDLIQKENFFLDMTRDQKASWKEFKKKENHHHNHNVTLEWLEENEAIPRAEITQLALNPFLGEKNSLFSLRQKVELQKKKFARIEKYRLEAEAALAENIAAAFNSSLFRDGQKQQEEQQQQNQREENQKQQQQNQKEAQDSLANDIKFKKSDIAAEKLRQELSGFMFQLEKEEEERRIQSEKSSDENAPWIRDDKNWFVPYYKDQLTKAQIEKLKSVPSSSSSNNNNNNNTSLWDEISSSSSSSSMIIENQKAIDPLDDNYDDALLDLPEDDRRVEHFSHPYYTDPNIVNFEHREEGVSCKNDVWSLGAVLLELCSGVVPFHKLEVELLTAQKNIESVRDGVFDCFHHPFILPENKKLLSDLPNLKGRDGWLQEFKTLSPECLDFIRRCMICDKKKRPSSKKLLRHVFLQGEFDAMGRRIRTTTTTTTRRNSSHHEEKEEEEGEAKHHEQETKKEKEKSEEEKNDLEKKEKEEEEQEKSTGFCCIA